MLRSSNSQSAIDARICKAYRVTEASPVYTFIECISSERFMRIAKWGNSLAVRLPGSVGEALNLKEGDDIKIRAQPGASFRSLASPRRETFFSA